MTGRIAFQEIDAKRKEVEELAHRLWEHPEVGYEEVNAAKWMAELLEQEGFQVEIGHAGVPTAVKAVWGIGKPVIGLLGELDALPELSQKVSAVKDPVKLGAPGHGCGHNLMCGSHVAAALGIKKELEERKLSGTVVVYGCPAEERLTGKTFMARGGAFRELDVAFSWHPHSMNYMISGCQTAMVSTKFHFKGLSAHAATDPWNGRSALDAAELMNVGAQFLREHVTSDVRIHYSFDQAGGAPNIVPDRASMWYFVRGLSRDTVADVHARLKRIANGAAMMTDTEVSEEFLGGCYETMQNPVLLELIHQIMEELPRPEWTLEELSFASKLNQQSPAYEKLLKNGAVQPGEEIRSAVQPIACENIFGSTDVGDVQHIVPGITFFTTCTNAGAAFHDWQFCACAGSSIGHKGMLHGAKIMAAAALCLIEDPALLARTKEAFDRSMHGKAYECPIPDEIPVG